MRKYVRKRAEDMNFTDDLMFRYVMRDPERCRMVLERVVGIRDIDRIEFLETQRDVLADIDARSVRLDVYLKDSKRAYTVEMQASREDAIGNRFRYYESVADVELLDSGQPYDRLREQIIIFFCTYQPFKGHNRCRYEFRTLCLEDRELELNDGVRKIVISSKGDFSEESEDVQAFLNYMNGRNGNNSLVESLERAVRKGRRSREMRRDAMRLDHLINAIVYDEKDGWLEEGIKTGLEKGREEGRAEGMAKGERKGKAEGESRFAALSQKLLDDSRQQDLIKAINDVPFRENLYKEYGIK